jgi:hypothetical protein
MGLTQDPNAAALEALMWDGIVTDNKIKPMQLAVEPKPLATGDVPRILREARRLVDEAIRASFLGARRPALERLKTGIDDRLCCALADKMGTLDDLLQKSLELLPDLVLTFYAEDAAWASQHLRAAQAKATTDEERINMALIVHSLARRLGIAPKYLPEQPPLFEAPSLPGVFKEPVFLSTLKELWEALPKELRKALEDELLKAGAAYFNISPKASA